MRLWSLHPRYLDGAGLVAVWREALLARAVLRGLTRGYHHHPQLERFRAAPRPVAAINAYLYALFAEAERRGYCFDRKKLRPLKRRERLPVSRGQLLFEWGHLRKKLAVRSPRSLCGLRGVKLPHPHPLFYVCDGEIASWEKRGKRRNGRAGLR